MRAEQLRRLAQERWRLAQMVPPDARASLLEIGRRGRATNVQQHHDSRQTRNVFLVPRAPFCERARRGIFTRRGACGKPSLPEYRKGGWVGSAPSLLSSSWEPSSSLFLLLNWRGC